VLLHVEVGGSFGVGPTAKRRRKSLLQVIKSLEMPSLRNLFADINRHKYTPALLE